MPVPVRDFHITVVRKVTEILSSAWCVVCRSLAGCFAVPVFGVVPYQKFFHEVPIPIEFTFDNIEIVCTSIAVREEHRAIA